MHIRLDFAATVCYNKNGTAKRGNQVTGKSGMGFSFRIIKKLVQFYWLSKSWKLV